MNINAGHEITSKARIIHQIQLIRGITIFHALTTALRREPRLRFTLTEVNDLPVRQTPMFTLLREAGFSSSPQGLDWG
ncbi:hypothetical protein QDW92_11745 [Escherichia coli]|nr:hypothetical protein [Escherichia coli]WHH10790.1 hypothetical protein QDW92_11745 [Escherichia coli]